MKGAIGMCMSMAFAPSIPIFLSSKFNVVCEKAYRYNALVALLEHAIVQCPLRNPTVFLILGGGMLPEVPNRAASVGSTNDCLASDLVDRLS